MKKLLAVLSLALVFASTSAYASSNYYVNEEAVQEVFSTSVETETTISITEDFLYNQNAQLAEKNALVAILLDFFLGGWGIHRVYLGGRPALILIYFITCGGIFGIVPLIDLIVMAINFDDISAYVGNDKFIMW